LYGITGLALSLGMLGLYEAIPRILTALPSGYIVEQFEKKGILLKVVCGYFLLSMLLWASMYVLDGKSRVLEQVLYGFVFIMGLIGSLGATASVTMFSSLIPKDDMPRYSAINSNAWQVGAIVGPVLGGVAIQWLGARDTMGVVCVCFLLGLIAISQLPRSPAISKSSISLHQSWLDIGEGLRYVFQNKTMLWAISLDLFAVLFGGCVALLPIFAKDILHTDSQGYGWLRSAMPLGSVVAMIYLAKNPLAKNTGKWLIFFVGLFGLATLGFAISTNFYLTMLLLILMGGFDAVSVVIRSALMLTETPDHMRARVSSVNSMFISSSNELGAFESGIAAEYMGAVRSVLFGGSMTLFFVALAWAKAHPLRNFQFKKKIV
jgi:MFS family permease